MNPLDRPIWAALTTRHSEFAVGGPLALRYQEDVEPFAAIGVDDESSVAALAQLLLPGEPAVSLQTRPSPLPEGCELVSEVVGVQMLSTGAAQASCPEGAAPLGEADSAEMVELAELTKPGPFRQRTYQLGNFWGIRRDGRLAAMAGERMKLPGFTEVSGVAVHPDWRGHGFARALSAFVASEIASRGETPFLHAYADNFAAIRLYESLGFAIRTEVRMQIIARSG